MTLRAWGVFQIMGGIVACVRILLTRVPNSDAFCCWLRAHMQVDGNLVAKQPNGAPYCESNM
jgi:hypothetical protein